MAMKGDSQERGSAAARHGGPHETVRSRILAAGAGEDPETGLPVGRPRRRQIPGRGAGGRGPGRPPDRHPRHPARPGRPARPAHRRARQGRLAIPAFLPDDGAGILFLDELNAAPPLVQAACYQLVLDRALGECRLPDGWTVFAAGNREGDSTVTSRMSSALANRFVHLSFEPDLDDWSRWAMGQADLRPEVVAFLRWRPDLLHRFEPAEKAFLSP